MNTEKHYLIKTYGCQMNVHESEKLAGALHSLGYTETANENNANIVVFNTCCIRDGAEQKLYAHIGALKKLKKANPNMIICVCGCASQAKGRAEIIKKNFPFVDIIFGTHNLHLFKEYLENFLESKKYVCDVWDNEREINENFDALRTSGVNAWVNISYGCNNYCSYCIVPFVRGRERSRKMDDIISEVSSLIASGYRYITLLGQNVNSYGNDIKDNNITFAKLLEKCAQLEGDFKIKFMTSHPKDLTEEVIKTIAKYDKICKVIHLPVQSGSNKILQAMNRKYTREHYLSLIENIKKHLPDCYISTDIIVGFPGETEEDFLQTYNLIKQVEYDGVFAFMYSKRTGTVAESMDNQVPIDIKRKRVNELLQLSKSITKQKNSQLIGKVFNVIIDSYDDNKKGYLAYTDSGKSIFIDCDNIDCKKNVELHTFKNAKIKKVLNNKLHGVWV